MGHVVNLNNNSHYKISFMESYTKYIVSGQCSRIGLVLIDFQIFLQVFFFCKTLSDFCKYVIKTFDPPIGPLSTPEDHDFVKFEFSLCEVAFTILQLL